jgi:hypothetical protein
MNKDELEHEISRLEAVKDSLLREHNMITEAVKDLDEELDLYRSVDISVSEQISNYPDLIVASGQTKSLVQRTHKFNRLIVESGGKLIVKGSARKWFIIHCENEVIINGEIAGNGIPFGSQPIESTCPSGLTISHSFFNSARGGHGGDGGPSRSRAGHRAQGGKGENGTQNYGGGGGGGASATCDNINNHRAFRGGNANGQIGGQPGEYGRGYGGDGGRSNRFGNGMLLYIHGTSFDGTNGVISLKGKRGDRGSDAGGGHNSSRCMRGGGGGGGGTPGGDGGVLIVETETLIEYPHVVVKGGKGGERGKGGKYSSPMGQNGRDGDNGEDGYVDWLTVQ